MEQFINQLLEKVPETQAIYRAHVEDNGSLLPHVFMGDVTRFVVQVARLPECKDLLGRLLVIVDEGLRSHNDELENLLAVSFIENLCGEDEAIATLLPMMGEATQREVKSICGYQDLFPR